MPDETQLHEAVVAAGKSLFDRGLTAGSSGNLSVRLDDGWLITPTIACLAAAGFAGTAVERGRGPGAGAVAPMTPYSR